MTTDTDLMYARAKAIWDAAATTRPPLLTAAEIAAGEWGERRNEDRAYEDDQLRAREEDVRW